MNIKSICISVACLLCLLGSALVCHSYELTILHNNDFHTHYEPINVWSSDCKPNQTCFGGIARTVTKVNQLTSSKGADSVLFLNGGDHFQGTIWYTFQKWKVVAKFVKVMAHDVMALGNHEFDDGVDGLIPFMTDVSQSNDKNLTIVCANIETSGQLKQLLRPSVVLERKGRKIAIIGYITPETSFLSQPGPTVKFLDEVESIRKEIDRLKQEDPTINIFIAVGHSGFVKDKEIAEKIPELDVVVGGHTNTFLYTGTPPSIEKPEGEYPVVYKHGEVGQTLVVQAFAYGKYLGVLDIEFDDDGKVVEYSGNPVLLDESVEEDEDTLEQVKEIRAQIEQQFGMTVGKSYVQLEQLSCREKECNAGNMFTDAFVHHFADLTDDRQDGWSPVAMCIVNGGNVRAGMSVGNLTMKDIVSAAPFGNMIGVLTVTGADLWKILQHSASQHKWGGFAQVSGIRYQFNSKKQIGKRLEWVRVKCARCTIPSYEDLDPAKTYKVAMNDYMAHGGDNYTMINKSNFDSASMVKDFDIITNYISKYSPITIGVEDRIIDSVELESSPTSSPTPGNENPSSESSAKSLNLSNCLIILFVCLYQLYNWKLKPI